MTRLALILALLQTGALPVLADYNLNGKTIDCYCTDTSGARVDLGETICLFVDGRSFMAQCQMSLNVPMWREISQGCLSSSLSPQRDNPTPHSAPVDPKV
jgi:hypothetical protein